MPRPVAEGKSARRRWIRPLDPAARRLAALRRRVRPRRRRALLRLLLRLRLWRAAHRYRGRLTRCFGGGLLRRLLLRLWLRLGLLARRRTEFFWRRSGCLPGRRLGALLPRRRRRGGLWIIIDVGDVR